MLTLHYHPLASYCHKVLIALYENATVFEPQLVDLGDAAASAAFKQLWPMAKMPVLRDDARDRTIPESTVIIEYLALHYPGEVGLIPTNPDDAVEVRLMDRFYDGYVHEAMQKIVADHLRPAGDRDAFGVAQARAMLHKAYAMIEQRSGEWAAGSVFSMADCAAAPALFYADKVEPFRDAYPRLAAFFDRLLQRPSYARVLEEAKPYFHMFPVKPLE